MNARLLATVVGAASLLFCATGRSEPSADVAKADAFFKAGKELRDAGQLAEACSLFAASKRIAPAIGVTLYLADCYERTGRFASAWAEFRNAETLGREHDDKRADTARDRARALEARLAGLTLTVSAATAQQMSEVLLDGTRVPPPEWNAAMAVDPGDHVVTVTLRGHPPRTLAVHVESGNRAATLAIDESQNRGDGEGAAAQSGAASTPTVAVEAAAVATPAPNVGRRWAGIGLMTAGAIGAGIGTTFLLNRDQPAAPSCTARTNDSSATGAVVAFSAGGLALASGIVLLLTSSHEGGSAWTIAPLPVTAGGGALLRARF